MSQNLEGSARVSLNVGSGVEPKSRYYKVADRTQSYRRNYQNTSQTYRILSYGWITLTILTAVITVMLVQYLSAWTIQPRTFGWKGVTSLMGLDVDDESITCDYKSWKNGSEVKVYKRCSPTFYFGFRSIGLLFYSGLYLGFFLLATLFLSSQNCRNSHKFRKMLDGLIFWTGVTTVLDIALGLLILNTNVRGLKRYMIADNMNLPDPFISHYWEATQTKGECCGVWGSKVHWIIPGTKNQTFPSSCCKKVDVCLEQDIWRMGCYSMENNHILTFGFLHIGLTVLLLVFLIHFDRIQRRIKHGARKTTFPKWLNNIFNSQEVGPIVHKRLFYVNPKRDWEGHVKSEQILGKNQTLPQAPNTENPLEDENKKKMRMGPS